MNDGRAACKFRSVTRNAENSEHLVDAEIDDVPAAAPTQVTTKKGLVYLGVCLVLIGLNLRTVFSSFSAVLPEITADAGLPGWAVVVLTTVPVTLLGVFAPLAPVLARRFGAERVLLGAMAILTAGLLLRPADVPGAGHLPALLAGTAACGAAIALCNVLLPGVVKPPATGPRRCGSGRCRPPSCCCCSCRWRSASPPSGTSSKRRAPMCGAPRSPGRSPSSWCCRP